MRLPLALALLVTLASLAQAQVPHEDFSRAREDEAAPARVASELAREAAEALNRSLADDPLPAQERAAVASLLAEAMEDAASAEARSATSPARLAPFAEASANLTASLERVVVDWEAWQTVKERGVGSTAEALQGRLLLGSLRSDVDLAASAARRLDALGAEATHLLAALARMRVQLEGEEPPAPREPGIALEAHPRQVPLSRQVDLRGVLFAEGALEGRVVRLFVDEGPWAQARVDERGFFSVARPVEDLAVGGHIARASAAVEGGELRSREAAFAVLRVPSNLTLSLPSRVVVTNGSADVLVRLLDADRRPVQGEVNLSVDGGEPRAVALDARGRGALRLDPALLGLGAHHVSAAYAGSARHGPAEAALAFEVVPEPPAPASVGIRLLAWAGPLGLVAVEAAVLVGLGPGRRLARWLVVLASPLLVGALAYAFLRDAPVASALAAASLAVGLGMLLRRDRAAAPAPMPAPAAPDGPARGAAASSAHGGDPLGELLAIYDALLRRLASEGVRTGPLTHREVADVLRARRCPEPAVAALTLALERALYAGAPLTGEDLAPVRDAARSLGVAA